MPDISRLPQPVSSVWDWQLHAACRGTDSSLFFGSANENWQIRQAREQQAKTICAGCSVQRQCRDHALAAREPYGIWGGLNIHDRQRLQQSDEDYYGPVHQRINRQATH